VGVGYLVDVLVEMGVIEGLGEQDVGFGSTHLALLRVLESGSSSKQALDLNSRVSSGSL
jgi:hypothetical protein